MTGNVKKDRALLIHDLPFSRGEQLLAVVARSGCESRWGFSILLVPARAPGRVMVAYLPGDGEDTPGLYNRALGFVHGILEALP